MDPDSSYQILLVIVLVILAGIFTMAETALFSYNKYRIKSMVTEFNSKGVLFKKCLESPNYLYNVIFIGKFALNISAIVLSIYWLMSYWQGSLNLFWTILCLGITIVLFSEIIPKTIASKYPEKLSTLFVRLFCGPLLVLYPIVIIFQVITNVTEKAFGLTRPLKEDNGVIEEEIINLVAAGQEDGVIHQEEKTMIHGVFDFTDTVVKDVMVPRPDIVAVEKNITFSELLKLIKEEQFSRIPVYDGSIDNILGVVHIKDILIIANLEQESFDLERSIRQTLFVPETKKVNELLKNMKKEKIHMAIVLDEYGSTAGLVTMEDLIEEIMGDIQDEHDTEEPEILRIGSDTLIINASLRIDEFNEIIHADLECEEAETVGGLIFAVLDRVPRKGDQIVINSWKLTVLQMDGHRIEKVRLQKLDHIDVKEKV